MLLVDIYRATYETFSPSPKNEKTHSEKMSYIFPKKVFLKFWEMELYGPKFKKLLYFFEKELFIYFRRELSKPKKQKQSTLKKFLILLQKSFPHISE